MWIFTRFGFFSVVQKPNDTALTVRSRTRGDLQRLRRFALPSASEPTAHEGTDYPWRMRCTAQEFGVAMLRECIGIDYGNFKDEVARSLGRPRASRYHAVWDALMGMPEDMPEPEDTSPCRLPWPVPAAGDPKPAFGSVVIDREGNVLLREVANHYDGYVWTFAKGRPERGELPRQTALRETREELGVQPRILLPLPGVFDGGVTRSHFFLMLADATSLPVGFQSDETASARWVQPAEARSLISQTLNEIGRARDLQVLELALAYVGRPRPRLSTIATPVDWRAVPLPHARRKLDFQREFTAEQVALMLRGLMPLGLDEGWFAWMDDGWLHIHRSWTGYEIYRLCLEPPKTPAEPWQVAQVWVNARDDQHTPEPDEAQALNSLLTQLFFT